MKSKVIQIVSFVFALSALLLWAQPACVAAGTGFSYTLTTQADPVQPGDLTVFKVTATNSGTGSATPHMSFDVPLFTTYGSSGATAPGSNHSVPFANVAVPVGQSESTLIILRVSTSSPPPEGGVLTLTVTEDGTSTTLSRSVVAHTQPAADLKFSTSEASVAAGGTFAYTLHYHNFGSTAITQAGLNLAVPAGATFVSAEGNPTLTSGVLHWSLGDLPPSSTGQLRAIFQAPAASGQMLLFEGALLDANSTTLAQASTTETVNAAPAFAYTLTVQDDPVQPGTIATFLVTARNLGAGTATPEVDFVVPKYTNYGLSGSTVPGTDHDLNFPAIPPGESRSTLISLRVGALGTVPEGGIIDLVLRDDSSATLLSRSIVIKSQPAADLKLSTEGSTVAPGGTFTYTLTYHNAGSTEIDGATLTMPIPAGTTLAALPLGATSDDVGLHWSPALPASSTAQVTASFIVPAAAAGPVVVEAVLRDAAGGVLAQASATKTFAAAPAFAYTLTVQDDPVQPGTIASFLVTATNVGSISSGNKSTTLDFVVPGSTSFGLSGSTAQGSDHDFTFASVPPGESRSFLISLRLGAVGTVPEGEIINLVVRDENSASLLARSIVVRSSPAADLKLSTESSTVAPGATFAYTLTYHNAGMSAIDGAQLTMPLPAGTTLVASTGNVTSDDAGLHWAVAQLPAGATAQVTASFSVPAGAIGALVVEAALRDASNQVLAQASTYKTIAATPAFTYTVTAQDDPARPGTTLSYLVTATNLGTGTSGATIDFVVPNYTTYGAGGSTAPGGDHDLVFSGILAGQSQSTIFNLRLSATGIPEGALVNFVVRDDSSGALLSRSVVLKSLPPADLKLSTDDSSVVPGGKFNYTLTYHNAGTSSIADAQLTMPVPAGTTYSPDGDGATLTNGVVQWALGDLDPDSTAQVTASFNAPAGANGVLIIEAALRDADGQALAQASTVKTVIATPAFTYTVSTLKTSAAPGATVSFTVTATNHGAGVQSAALDFVVPTNTTYGSSGGPGGVHDISFSNVAAGQSLPMTVDLRIPDTTPAVPEGTIIDLTLRDDTLAAVLSHSIVVNTPAPGHLQFSQPTYTVSEGAGAVSVVVTRAGGTVGAVSAKLNTTNGSATATSDYTALKNRVVTFADGDGTSQTIMIPIKADTLVEGDEVFHVVLSAPTGHATLGAVSSAAVTIANDDTGTIAVQEPIGMPLSSGVSTVDFGPVITGKKATLTFVVKSTGSGNLSGLTAKIDEPDRTVFTVSGPTIKTLLPNGATTFKVTFFAKAAANYAAVLHVGSSDLATPHFDINLAGLGTNFVAQAGIFAGRATSGSAYLKLTLSAAGGFSGTLIDKGITYRLSGAFDALGNYTGHLAVPLTLHVENLGAGPAATVTGSVDGDALTLNHGTYVARTVLAQAGLYNVLLDPSGAPSEVPPGLGYVALKVAATGTASIVGRLADGTVVSNSSVLVTTAGGPACPFYQALAYSPVVTRGDKGTLSGNVVFASVGTSDCQGTATWMKPEVKTGAYLHTFERDLAMTGSVYHAPLHGGSVLPGFTDGTLTLSDHTSANLASGPFQVTLTPPSTLVSSNNQVVIKIVPSTGAFTGHFLYPGQTKATTFMGLLLPTGTRAGGYFLGPNGSGTVSIAAVQ